MKQFKYNVHYKSKNYEGVLESPEDLSTTNNKDIVIRMLNSKYGGFDGKFMEDVFPHSIKVTRIKSQEETSKEAKRDELPSWGNSYIGKAAKFGAGKISEKIEERNNRTPEEIAYKEEQDRIQREKVAAQDAEFIKNAGVFFKKYWWTVIIAVGLVYGLIYLNKHKTKSSAAPISTTEITEPATSNEIIPANSENSSQVVTEETHNLATNDANGFSTLDVSNIKGEYAGTFGKDVLTINIEDLDLDGGNVIGYNLVKENKRTLKGNATKTNNPDEIKLTLSEPGDDKWDGVFEFVLNTLNNTAIGQWKSNNGKSTKEFNLNKK